VVSRNPYLFVVGCPRSGTTLLRRMLDAHPDLAITPETHWIPIWFERRNGVTRDGRAGPELVARLLAYPKFRRTGLGREELESLLDADRPVSYSSFVQGFFDLYGRTRGKALVGDKTPGYVRRLPLLHELFPEARFVHLIRDGRDVCLSAVNWQKAVNLARRFPTWSEQPVVTAALWWEWNVRLGRDGGASLGRGLYHELRYEALVADPAEACRELCAFLDLPYDEAMLRFHEGRTRSDPGLDSKKAWLPPTRGLRDWRTQMPEQDVERFEAAAGELLDELGYPRSSLNPRPEAIEQAAEIRELFAESTRPSGRALQESL
jgi:GNAT superfamily N-acetyltransferase